MDALKQLGVIDGGGENPGRSEDMLSALNLIPMPRDPNLGPPPDPRYAIQVEVPLTGGYAGVTHEKINEFADHFKTFAEIRNVLDGVEEDTAKELARWESPAADHGDGGNFEVPGGGFMASSPLDARAQRKLLQLSIMESTCIYVGAHYAVVEFIQAA